jgi:hypothetical protein
MPGHTFDPSFLTRNREPLSRIVERSVLLIEEDRRELQPPALTFRFERSKGIQRSPVQENVTVAAVLGFVEVDIALLEVDLVPSNRELLTLPHSQYVVPGRAGKCNGGAETESPVGFDSPPLR